ncbi:MAG: hypothetical protein QM622_04330 [Microbacterium sp.]
MTAPTVTPRELAPPVLAATFLSTQELRSRGLSERRTAEAVSLGRLLRVRRGRYLDPVAHPDLVRAATLGGRLDCVSLLTAIGVFVREHDCLHLQFEHGSSRLPARPPRTAAHWRTSARGSADLAADLVDALAQACRCQRPRDAIATLDSAWHHGLVDEAGLADVFARLPGAYRRLRPLLDQRAESGPETLMRLMLRGLGCHVEVQVHIDGVGRVDLVVDGWLIVECDSRAFHEGWIAQKNDRRRDLAAAARGYTTVRPIAEDILATPDVILAAFRRILAAHAAANSSPVPQR